jgi:S1-C subfamily serine protease
LLGLVAVIAASAVAVGQPSTSARDLELQYAKSVVKIVTSGRDPNGNQKIEQGNGVFIAEGAILTARHVVGQDSEWYRNSGEPDRRVDVYALDDDNVERKIAQTGIVRLDPFVDAALILINPTKRAPAEISFKSTDFSVVYPYVWDRNNNVPEVRSAEIARTDVISSGPGIRFRGPFRQGHSGAPVFDSEHRLLGIITVLAEITVAPDAKTTQNCCCGFSILTACRRHLLPI